MEKQTTYVGMDVHARTIGHVPQAGVTAHHPSHFLTGSLQQHLLAWRELAPRRGEQRHHRHVAPRDGPFIVLL